jgi:hypothetical protein
VRVTRIEYPGDNSAVIVIKCVCGARFRRKVDRRKLVECEVCSRAALVDQLADQYHTERMLAKIGE